MANVVAAFQRTLRPSVVGRAVRSSRSLWHARAIHSTPAALKQKQKASSSKDDDLFGDADEEDDSLFGSSSDDLFSDRQTPSTPSPPKAFSHPQDIPPHNPSVPISAQFGPSVRFDELYQFLRAHLVDKNEKRVPRTTVWTHTFNVTTTSEQLERVVELMPKWRDVKREFNANTAEQFALRCQKLACPQLALKVFGDRSKYGLDLTMPAARSTLHGLLMHAPQDALTFTSLFSIYNLPPVSADLYCTAALMRALFLQNTAPSLVVAKSMVPSLQQLLQNTDPASLGKGPQKKRVRDVVTEKWLAYTLAHLGADLENHAIEHGWLEQWMGASGLAVHAAKSA